MRRLGFMQHDEMRTRKKNGDKNKRKISAKK